MNKKTSRIIVKNKIKIVIIIYQQSIVILNCNFFFFRNIILKMKILKREFDFVACNNLISEITSKKIIY